MDKDTPPALLPEIIGHRGNPYQEVENTLGSIQSAFAAGADAVELDVQLTKDGVPVLYHDRAFGATGFFLDRYAYPHVIQSYTISQLKQAKFNQAQFESKLSQSAGEAIRLQTTGLPQITTLEEVLLALPKNKQVYLELKYPSQFMNPGNALAVAVVDLIQQHSLQDRAIVISFNVPSLRQIKQLAPEIQTGLNISDNFTGLFIQPTVIKVLKNWLGIAYWLPSFNAMTSTQAKLCHGLGLKMVPWVSRATIKQEQVQLKTLLTFPVDGLITNQPGYLQAALSQALHLAPA